MLHMYSFRYVDSWGYVRNANGASTKEKAREVIKQPERGRETAVAMFRGAHRCASHSICSLKCMQAYKKHSTNLETIIYSHLPLAHW